MVKETGKGRVPDDQDDQVDFVLIGGIKINPFLRPPDGYGDLSARVHTGMGNGDALAEGRRIQALAVDEPGQDELFVPDQFLLGQDIKELFNSLDFVLGAKIMNDLGRFQIIGKVRNP